MQSTVLGAWGSSFFRLAFKQNLFHKFTSLQRLSLLLMLNRWWGFAIMVLELWTQWPKVHQLLMSPHPLGVTVSARGWLLYEQKDRRRELSIIISTLDGFFKNYISVRITVETCMCAMSLQSCSTLCDPMNCSLPGSSVHGILQARILEWVACPPPGDLPDPGIKPVSLMSPTLAGGSLPSQPIWLILGNGLVMNFSSLNLVK